MSESLVTCPRWFQNSKLVTRHFEKTNLADFAPSISYLPQSVCLLGEKEAFLTEIPLCHLPPQKANCLKEW